nr:TIGR04086 family membrane protein [Clostridia bacterium]
MNNISKVEKNNTITIIAKGYVFSLIISLISLFIYAIILLNTNIQENTIKPVVITITGISILVGSSITSSKIKKNGIVNGVCVGGLYLGSLYILSSIAFSGFSLTLSSIIMIVIGSILGGIGGIIGVNIRR